MLLHAEGAQQRAPVLVCAQMCISKPLLARQECARGMLRCVQGAELPVHRWAELHPVCTAPVSSAPPWSCIPRARHKASGAPRQCQPCCASTWLWAPVSATRAMRLCDSHSAVGSAGGCGEQQGVEAAGSRQGCGPWAARGLGAGTRLLAGGTQPASSVLTPCTSVHAVLLTLALLSAAPGFPRAVSAAVLPVPVPRSGPRAPPIGALLSPGARCVCQAQALLPSTCASQPPLLRTPCLLSVELPTTNHCPCCTVLLCEQLPLLWSPITPTQHPTPHPSPALLASQIPNSWRWERTRPSGRDVLAAPTLGSPVLCALPTRAPGSVPLDVCTCSRPPQHTRCLSAPRLPSAPGPRGPGQRLHGSARMAVSSLPLLHVPTPPWRCPEVSRCWWSCFCCPSVLMDASPRSRRSRSCLLLRTVRPCTATHPLLTAGLDSPSAHAHALAALGACRCHAQLRARGCHARSVQARAHGEARGSPRVTLLCCGCHHPPAAPAHVLILGSSLLSPRHSPVLILGSLLALCWRTRGSR